MLHILLHYNQTLSSPKHLEAHAERRKRIQFTRESVKPTIEASPEGQPEEPGMKVVPMDV
eukprot:1240113-Amorphochlora_amoeboformis.AAC.1